MTDFTPFEDLLRGHAGLLEDSTHDRWLRAQALFEERAYREAAALLTELLDALSVDRADEGADDGAKDGAEDGADGVRHELTDVRLLLARSLFHSAQLDGTIRVATELLEHDPNEPYAHLLLGRAMQRQGRRSEAQPHLRLAELLGGYRS